MHAIIYFNHHVMRDEHIWCLWHIYGEKYQIISSYWSNYMIVYDRALFDHNSYLLDVLQPEFRNKMSNCDLFANYILGMWRLEACLYAYVGLLPREQKKLQDLELSLFKLSVNVILITCQLCYWCCYMLCWSQCLEKYCQPMIILLLSLITTCFLRIKSSLWFNHWHYPILVPSSQTAILPIICTNMPFPHVHHPQFCTKWLTCYNPHPAVNTAICPCEWWLSHGMVVNRINMKYWRRIGLQYTHYYFKINYDNHGVAAWVDCNLLIFICLVIRQSGWFHWSTCTFSYRRCYSSQPWDLKILELASQMILLQPTLTLNRWTRF